MAPNTRTPCPFLGKELDSKGLSSEDPRWRSLLPAPQNQAPKIHTRESPHSFKPPNCTVAHTEWAAPRPLPPTQAGHQEDQQALTHLSAACTRHTLSGQGAWATACPPNAEHLLRENQARTRTTSDSPQAPPLLPGDTPAKGALHANGRALPGHPPCTPGIRGREAGQGTDRVTASVLTQGRSEVPKQLEPERSHRQRLVTTSPVTGPRPAS